MTDQGLIALGMATGAKTNEQLERAVDLLEAMYTDPKPTKMTGLDLAKFFELPIQENGQPNWTDFLNACLHVQRNEKVQALPDDERIQIIQLAAACLSRAGLS